MTSFYLTAPIYYVNAHPHLGHAFTTIVADTITRFQQISGKDAIFITGTDEHGDKIVQAAEKVGKTLEEFTSSISNEFRSLWPKLDSFPNEFIRTTDPKHKVVVQDFLQKVYDNGDIYFGEYGGHYCYGCERFYTEKELENGLCPQHQVKPEFISEKNYFFRMSKYKDWLKQHILDNQDFIRPERYRNEALGLLENDDLEDLCISRPKSRLTWGIELPFDKDYVCYVWFDALLSYITALDGTESEKFKKYWPNSEHLVAKDILKPHAIFWPTMLKSAGLPIYKHLNVHGYWLIRDTKMSKSLGNIVSPLEIVDKYGIDAFRYVLMREMVFGNDASFSEEVLISRINSDLANDLGNLFSRVLSMNAKYCNGKVPVAGEDTDLEKNLKDLSEQAFTNYKTLFKNIRFSQAIESLWELVRAMNKYVDTAAPWVLAKNGDTQRIGTVLYTLLELMRKTAVHLWPIMPRKVKEMLDLLGISFDKQTLLLQKEQSFGLLKPGIDIAHSSSLFPRIIVEKNEEFKVEETKKEPTSKQEKSSYFIDFSDFQKLDLRVGTVLECEQHPNADKLLRFMVDLGEDRPRQILSGIAAFFKPEKLIGKQVVVLVNLPTRKMRGLESQGMILSVENGERLELLTPDSLVVNGGKIS